LNNSAHSQLSDFQPEQIIGGRYRVLSVLGRGGMGVVYRVEQIFLGLDLALKTIDLSSMTDMAVRRFQAEARAVFALNHPNIISVHDFGMLENQSPFLAMEFVQGESLASIFKKRTLTVEEAIPIFIQVCNGLAHAHNHSVVHRDIKPGNIMLSSQLPQGTEGSVKILDFGIAKVGEYEAGEIQSLTRTGEIFGSPLYMSPEQCSGGKVDHRSDIYSLGCVIFEALTGTTPYVGESALSTMMMHQSADIPSLKEASLGTDFPDALEQIVHSMLVKNPSQRYQNLNDTVTDLSAALHGEAIRHSTRSSTKQSKVAQSTSKTVSMRRETLIAVLLVTVFMGTTLGIGTTTMALTASRKIVAVPRPVINPLFPGTDHTQDFVEDIKKKEVSFSSTWHAEDASLIAFRNYDGAQSLQFDTCMITDDGLSALRKSHLINLKLDGCNITRVKNICQQNYLQNLDLRGTYIDDSALPDLASMKMLDTLSLRNCHKLTNQGLQALAKSTSLRVVMLSGKQFSPAVVDELRKRMPGCTFDGYGDETSGAKTMNTTAEMAYQSALKELQVAQQINPNHTVVARRLMDVSNYYQSIQNYAQAEKVMAQARKVLETNGNKAALAEILQASGVLELAQKHVQERDQYCDQAAKLSIDTMMHNRIELIQRLDELTVQPYYSTIFENSIRNSQIALNFIRRFKTEEPKMNQYLPIFTERIGTYLVNQHKNSEALPYLREYCDLCRQAKSAHPKVYAKSLLELGIAEPDVTEKKKIWNEALDLLDSLKHPGKLNLRERYCDCCVSLMEIYDQENNRLEAYNYALRGLKVAETLEEDPFDRKTYFKKLMLRRLFRLGKEKEARQEAQKYGLKWSQDLQ
jgi:serine/threonine protein kinase